MGRKLTSDLPIFFVCGTPINRHGFVYKALDERLLPGAPAKYLDIVSREQLPKRGKPTYALCRIAAGGSKAAVYAEYRWIQPNDDKANRGAYIAVGCWAEAPLALAQAVEALHRIEAIHDDLAGRRDPDTGAFPHDFQLKVYTAPDLIKSHRGQWADLLYRAASAAENSGRKLVFTSEEIEQGKLEKHVTRTETPDPRPPRPTVPGNRSWRDYLQEAMNEAPPPIRRELQMYARMEEEMEEKREKISRILARTVDNAPRKAPNADRGLGFIRRKFGFRR